MQLRSSYLYITSFLLGFTLFMFTLNYPNQSLNDILFANSHSLTGIVLDYDKVSQKLHVATLDVLRFNSIASSTYEVILRTHEATKLIDQDLLIENDKIWGLTEERPDTDLELKRGDFIFVLYRNTPNGFLSDRILRGKPMPTVDPFTPQYLELQAAVLTASPQ